MVKIGWPRGKNYMILRWKWRLGAALLGVTLWSYPVAAAKIERFKDTEGTLHIHNEGEEAAKPGGAATPNTPAAPQPLPPPPVAPPMPPPPAPVPQPQEPVAPPPAEEGEAPPVMQPETPANPPAEQAAPEAQAEPGEGSSLTGTIPPSAAAWSAPIGMMA